MCYGPYVLNQQENGVSLGSELAHKRCGWASGHPQGVEVKTSIKIFFIYAKISLKYLSIFYGNRICIKPIGM